MSGLQRPCTQPMRSNRKRKRVCAPPLMRGGRMRSRAPHIDAGEQEQPDHVDKVPIPGGELKAEMLRRCEVAEIDPDQTDDEECRTDDDMEAVEAGRHEEGRAIDVAAEVECRMAVLVGLHAREGEPERNGANEP